MHCLLSCHFLVIKAMARDPHTRHIRKMDPVARFQKYRQSWQCQNAPGENSHKNLRWNVRAQMLYHDPVIQKVGQLDTTLLPLG